MASSFSYWGTSTSRSAVQKVVAARNKTRRQRDATRAATVSRYARRYGLTGKNFTWRDIQLAAMRATRGGMGG